MVASGVTGRIGAMPGADVEINAGRQFFINGTLLADETGGWRNLGDWTATEVYREAAEALAMRVGTAAGLCEHTAVLDLACGYGASLLLWQCRFGVSRVAGLELQSDCFAADNQVTLHPSGGDKAPVIVQGRFDHLPLPAALMDSPFNAVVCVDAAYHARSLTALSSVASSALRSGGTFAFTTLAINPAAGGLPVGLMLALRASGISRVSTPSDIEAALAANGFRNIAVEVLDEAVLVGFDRYVARRERELTWRQRLSADWLKIKATGWLCGALAHRWRLHYVLVRAVRG